MKNHLIADIEALEDLQELRTDPTVWRLRNLILSMYETIRNHEEELSKYYNAFEELNSRIDRLESQVLDLQNND